METKAEQIANEIIEEKQQLVINAVLTTITFVGLVVGIISGLFGFEWYFAAAAYLAAYLAGGLPATIEAIKSLREKSLDINLLMIAAALAAAGVGEPRDGAILLFLFSLASTLEGYAMGNTKRAIVALLDLRPDEANKRLDGGKTEKVAVDNLVVGDVVVVRPGERIAIDGVVLEGVGAVDQAPITGESVPSDKQPGEIVFAGTVNLNAVLVITVSKKATESTLSRMIELVLEAQEKRSPSERFSEWFGARYTFVVLFGSLIMLGIFILIGIPLDLALYKAATLLVVASPCAIVISVPAAVLSALAVSARSGILFKGGAALETFGAVDIFAFDKTGTLTSGNMSVQKVMTFAGSEEVILSYAGTLEEHSDHPVAKSVTAYVKQENIKCVEATACEAVFGKGVTGIVDGKKIWAGNRSLATLEGVTLSDEQEQIVEEMEKEGYTSVLVGSADSVLGVIGVADTIRDNTVPALEALLKRGIKQFHMLTGDTANVAYAVGSRLNLDKANIHGGLLPEDKVTIVNNLREQGTVAFVGDGVNDAAALASAHVGIAMGVAGSDVAIEAADVALLSDDLSRLAYAHRVSKQANQIIKQNLIFAIGIMAVMVVITTFWYLPLPLGVIGHEGGTLLVVANGLRLLLVKP